MDAMVVGDGAAAMMCVCMCETVQLNGLDSVSDVTLLGYTDGGYQSRRKVKDLASGGRSEQYIYINMHMRPCLRVNLGRPFNTFWKV